MLDRLADDLGSLRQQVERLAAAVGYAAGSSGFSPLAQADNALQFSTLVRAGVYPEIAHDLISRASGGTRISAAPSNAPSRHPAGPPRLVACDALPPSRDLRVQAKRRRSPRLLSLSDSLPECLCR